MDADLNLTFSALADPTRRAILARLATGDATVNTLAAPFAISGPAISRHLKVLERAGLIARGRDAQWRPCRLAAAPLKDAAAWLDRYRRFWEASLDRLDDYLREVQSTAEGSPPPPRSPGTPRPAPRRAGRNSPRRRKNPKEPEHGRQR